MCQFKQNDSCERNMKCFEVCCQPSYYNEEKEEQKFVEKNESKYQERCNCPCHRDWYDDRYDNKNECRKDDRREERYDCQKNESRPCARQNRCCCSLFRRW